jgi:ABC-type bacteriocin/lantibiotic exporter with double-glycine peptidase domain
MKLNPKTLSKSKIFLFKRGPADQYNSFRKLISFSTKMEKQSLHIVGNLKCAIIGKTGAGKSTAATVLAEV